MSEGAISVAPRHTKHLSVATVTKYQKVTPLVYNFNQRSVSPLAGLEYLAHDV